MSKLIKEIRITNIINENILPNLSHHGCYYKIEDFHSFYLALDNIKIIYTCTGENMKFLNSLQCTFSALK